MESRLEYFPPTEEGVVRLEAGELEEGRSRWKNALVVYTLGTEMLSADVLREYAKVVWRVKGAVDLLQLRDGLFLVKCSSDRECIRILGGGPWFFKGAWLVVDRGSPGSVGRRDFEEVPVWVKLRDLDWHLRSKRIISKLVSAVGRPIGLGWSSCGFPGEKDVRACVWVATGEKLRDHIAYSEDDGAVRRVRVAYSWFPKGRSEDRLEDGNEAGGEEGEVPGQEGGSEEEEGDPPPARVEGAGRGSNETGDPSIQEGEALHGLSNSMHEICNGYVKEWGRLVGLPLKNRFLVDPRAHR